MRSFIERRENLRLVNFDQNNRGRDLGRPAGFGRNRSPGGPGLRPPATDRFAMAPRAHRPEPPRHQHRMPVRHRNGCVSNLKLRHPLLRGQQDVMLPRRPQAKVVCPSADAAHQCDRRLHHDRWAMPWKRRTNRRHFHEPPDPFHTHHPAVGRRSRQSGWKLRPARLAVDSSDPRSRQPSGRAADARAGQDHWKQSIAPIGLRHSRRGCPMDFPRAKRW